ncbi:LysR family transcriptional regulator substrate-binding protein [Nocardioides sp. R-C-SC26]|uniref:LysR family transcriptional regulator substrate-binding protein n=1 Tax=Nocardioides sp. R-C-SC26 TaxID=2870414 RepID=UPI001E2F0693|nr:LysR family transcriptional regulator substrate-binding protein [Nocardioides sp. R-C-SC26]
MPLDDVDLVDGVRDGTLDMAIVRLPVELDGAHSVRLYEELPVVIASHEHLIAATDEADEISVDDLAEEQLVLPHTSGWTPRVDQLVWPAMSPATAIETVAAGTGVAIVPMSVARLHARKDVVWRVVGDLEPTTVALVWLRDRDDHVTQAFVGVVRGRTGRSSRD